MARKPSLAVRVGLMTMFDDSGDYAVEIPLFNAAQIDQCVSWLKRAHGIDRTVNDSKLRLLVESWMQQRAKLIDGFADTPDDKTPVARAQRFF